MMLRCDREYLLVGALIYRKPLRSITNRLERGDQCVVRFDGSLYRNIIGLAEANRLALAIGPSFQGFGGQGVAQW
jgi:hypothetical protein